MSDQTKNRILQGSLVLGALLLISGILYLAFWSNAFLTSSEEEEEEEKDIEVKLAFETPYLPTKEKFETYQKWKDDEARFKKEYEREFPLETLKIVELLNQQNALISENDDEKTKKLKEKLSEYHITKTNLDVVFPRKTKYLFSTISPYIEGEQTPGKDEFYTLNMPFIEKDNHYVGLATMNQKDEEGYRYLKLRFMLKEHTEVAEVEKILNKYVPTIYQENGGIENIDKGQSITGESYDESLNRHFLHDSLANNLDCLSGGEFNKTCIDTQEVIHYQDIEHTLTYESNGLPYFNSAIPYLSLSNQEKVTHLPAGQVMEAVYFIDMTPESLGGFVDRVADHVVEIDGEIYKLEELKSLSF